MDTPMLMRLKEYFQNTSVEQQRKDWESVKALNLTGSPSVWEFMAGFKHTPAYSEAVIPSWSSSSSADCSFSSLSKDHQLAMAA